MLLSPLRPFAFAYAVLGLALLALLVPSSAQAQSALRPTPATTIDLPPILLEDVAPGDTMTVEFAHAGLTYQPDDTIRLFGASGAPLSTARRQLRLLCPSFGACSSSAARDEAASTLPQPATTPSTGYRWPLRFRATSALIPRTYLVEVRDGSGTVKHYRRLRLVPPAPYVEHVTVHQDAVAEDAVAEDAVAENRVAGADASTLLVDPTQDLDATIVLTGGPFYAGTQVHLQDTPLVVRRRTRDELVLDLTLDAETTAQLELGVWPLQFRHPLAAHRHANDWNAVLATVTLRGQEPPILQPPQPLNVVGTQSGRVTREVTVAGFYFSPHAELCTERGPLVTAGCIGITQHHDQTLTAPVVLDIPEPFSGGRFTLYVRNGDGQESTRQTVRVRPQQVTARVSAVSPDEPVVEGVPTEVIFHREAARPFPTTGPYSLEVNGHRQALPPIQPPTADALRTTVTLPDGTGGQQPVFVLSAGGRSWAGTFDTVVERPRLIAAPPVIRPGNDARLTFIPPTENGHLMTHTPGLTIEGGGLYDGEARLRTAPDLAGSSASVLVRVRSRVVDSLQIPIEPWPAPSQVLTLHHGDRTIPLDSASVITLTEDQPLHLRPTARYVATPRPPRVHVQLRDDNGRALQNPFPVRFDRAEPTTIYPSTWGLSGGDAFTLTLETPDGRTVHRRAYIRRPLVEQFVVSGGLTAVEYSLSRSASTRGNTLSGVNLAVHWTPEWFAPTLSRPLGFGVHTVASERENQVRLRLAASVLLFEKLAIGMSAGPGGPALFVGANASFLDLSTLFSGPGRRTP